MFLCVGIFDIFSVNDRVPVGNSLISWENIHLARFLRVSDYRWTEEAEDIMKLLENDVALITILTLLLFSLVKFQDVLGDSSGAAAETRTGSAVERVP